MILDRENMGIKTTWDRLESGYNVQSEIQLHSADDSK